MCLLFTRVAGVSQPLSDEWLKDFYSHNRDGFGVMYAEDGLLWTAKGLGSADDWIKFYRQHEHRTAAFHLRMKTHGHIDLENCHPYEVYGDGSDMPVYFMHNGVLHTGNEKDRSKSDTWHFVRDFIHPLTKNDPAVIFTPEFESVMGKFIGNNRFAFMNHNGDLQIVNKNQGVEWQGMWLSNTYAWDYYKAFPDKRTAYYGGSEWYGKGKYDPKRTTEQVTSDYAQWRKDYEKKQEASRKQAQEAKKLTKTQPTITHPTQTRLSLVDKSEYDVTDDVLVATDDIMVRSTEVYEKTTLKQVERLFAEFGSHDAWRWIEAFSYSTGKEAEERFLNGMRDPRKIKDWLNKMDQTEVMDYL